jgi:Uma2 family endonuclease
MASVLFEERLEIPLGVSCLGDFRRWLTSEDFPQTGRIDFVADRIEVDMSPEELFSHGRLKGKVYAVLLAIIEDTDLGYLFVDRARVTCPEAGLSVEPDIVFVSHARLDDQLVRLVPKASGERGRFMEMEGPPDLVVEIVSDSSVGKDTQRLPSAYFRAGVGEYWLLDARREELLFRIHVPGKDGFLSVQQDDDGWLVSRIFACSFRLTRRSDRRGHWFYSLETRA